MKRKLSDLLSFDFLREQLLGRSKNSERAGPFDPRVMLLWYCFFGVAPWFFESKVLLAAIFVYCAAVAVFCKTKPLFLLIFLLGVLGQGGVYLIVSQFLGGGAAVIEPLLILSLKLATVSLASIIVFTGLEAEKLALGLLWLGFPERLAFSVSFSYRMLPILLDELASLTRSFLTRGSPPDRSTARGKLKYIVYRGKITVMVFYPLLLNMAKRSRTTAEALTLRGYLFAAENPAVRREKLSALKAGKRDAIFVAVALVWMAGSLVLAWAFA